MRKNLKSLLKSANLRDEEIVIYILLLKLGEAPISRLINESTIPTTTVYRTINRLMERGMVEGSLINQKQRIFRPLTLSSLLAKVRIEQKKLDRLRRSLEGLDEFVPYMNTESEEDLIEIREGLDAFREEYLRLPNLAKEDLCTLGSVPIFWNTAGYSYDAPEERNFIRKRMAKGVFARVFNEDEKDVYEFQKNDSLEKRTTKLKHNLPGNENLLLIIEDQSLFFICDKENPRVVINRQPELLQLQKDQYFSLWSEV